jgi:hypothetical protein
MYHGAYVLILRGINVEVAIQQGDPALLRFRASTGGVPSEVRAAPFRGRVLEVRDQNGASRLTPFLRGIRVLGGRTRLSLRGLMLLQIPLHWLQGLKLLSLLVI